MLSSLAACAFAQLMVYNIAEPRGLCCSMCLLHVAIVFGILLRCVQEQLCLVPMNNLQCAGWVLQHDDLDTRVPTCQLQCDHRSVRSPKADSLAKSSTFLHFLLLFKHTGDEIEAGRELDQPKLRHLALLPNALKTLDALSDGNVLPSRRSSPSARRPHRLTTSFGHPEGVWKPGNHSGQQPV